MGLELRTMRTTLLALFALLASILVGCSMPEHVVLRNNSAQTLSITFSNGKTTVVAPGQSAELSFDYFFMQASVAIDGAKRIFRWRLPPREMMDQTNYPWRFTLSLEPDGKIYVVKAIPTGADVRPLRPQPEGYPLTSS